MVRKCGKSGKRTQKKSKRGGSKTLMVKDVNKALNTGVGVAEEMGSLGMNVGKTAVKEVEAVGSEGIKLSKKSMKFTKKMLSKKNKKSKKGKKGKKNSYRTFLSKRLKEVKRKHPSWPQSKVFKEAVKGWKSKSK
jgi:Trm5-related predicted tRNA methylase